MSSPVSLEPSGATPAMRQYFDAKRQYRDAILFFRMGDFYEMFYEDALTAARALELTLTSRSRDSSGGAIPMCGVPFHAADSYITRLVKKGWSFCTPVSSSATRQPAPSTLRAQNLSAPTSFDESASIGSSR